MWIKHGLYLGEAHTLVRKTNLEAKYYLTIWMHIWGAAVELGEFGGASLSKVIVNWILKNKYSLKGRAVQAGR